MPLQIPVIFTLQCVKYMYFCLEICTFRIFQIQIKDSPMDFCRINRDPKIVYTQLDNDDLQLQKFQLIYFNIFHSLKLLLIENLKQPIFLFLQKEEKKSDPFLDLKLLAQFIIMNCMSDECQEKFQQILQLKDLFSIREVLPQRVQKQKMFDIKFQLRQIRHQKLKRLDQIINSSIQSQPTQYQQGTEKEISKYFKSLFLADQQNMCLGCDKYIFEKKVSLLCWDKLEHSYHSSCLAKMLKQQLESKCIKFYCICKSQIKNGQIIRQKYFDLEVYVDKLMENQIQYLKSRLTNIKTCANKNCNFFWLLNDSVKKRSKSQCKSYPITYFPSKTSRITYLNFCPHCRFL
ncbi:unnamed protein product [Paramecium octaurelia]|uniref:Uncharacterized protein n=1 Tax=Paramecium octaurelia TaxID=43137 RepID=A0A8S1SPB8_PAROT|nr:unnamed protein product [Paramecium octaurelia]